MVGGVIIGLTHSTRDANPIVHVNVADCPHHPKHGIKAESVEGCPHPDTCCVYTDGLLEDGTKAAMKVGDSFWWQGGRCYWTPKENRTKPGGKCGTDYDIVLMKIGYSH